MDIIAVQSVNLERAIKEAKRDAESVIGDKNLLYCKYDYTLQHNIVTHKMNETIFYTVSILIQLNPKPL